MKPYAIISDVHFHKWQAFSSITQDGMNSRLEGLILELYRVAAELRDAGGNVIYCAGDVFHVRGSISPSVLNPAQDAFGELIEQGFDVRMIPGNHDLEGKHSTRLGSAVTALEGKGVRVVHEATFFKDEHLVMVPWYEKLDDLRAKLKAIALDEVDYGTLQETTVIIHAPLNGVITGLPDHGLSTTELQEYGFKRVFVGHHHNHKDMGGGVYSIGALAHHTWSDVGSKAGFLIVDGDEVKWFKSHLPEFVDLKADMSELDAELAADQNFVRIKIADTNMGKAQEIRDWLTKSGAKGIVIQPVKTATVKREGSVSASMASGASLEASVSEYIKSKYPLSRKAIDIECQRILAEVGA